MPLSVHLLKRSGRQASVLTSLPPDSRITDATAWLPEEQKTMIASMTPLQRIATPEDVAGAVLAMASNHSRFVTGCYVPVSGGLLML